MEFVDPVLKPLPESALLVKSFALESIDGERLHTPTLYDIYQDRDHPEERSYPEYKSNILIVPHDREVSYRLGSPKLLYGKIKEYMESKPEFRKLRSEYDGHRITIGSFRGKGDAAGVTFALNSLTAINEYVKPITKQPDPEENPDSQTSVSELSTADVSSNLEQRVKQAVKVLFGQDETPRHDAAIQFALEHLNLHGIIELQSIGAAQNRDIMRSLSGRYAGENGQLLRTLDVRLPDIEKVIGKVIGPLTSQSVWPTQYGSLNEMDGP